MFETDRLYQGALWVQSSACLGYQEELHCSNVSNTDHAILEMGTILYQENQSDLAIANTHAHLVTVCSLYYTTIGRQTIHKSAYNDIWIIYLLYSEPGRSIISISWQSTEHTETWPIHINSTIPNYRQPWPSNPPSPTLQSLSNQTNGSGAWSRSPSLSLVHSL